MRLRKARSNDKILHDEYFGDQPSAAFLLAARLVLLCVMSASFVLIFCELYGYTGNAALPCCIAAAASGTVYMLASLFPQGIVYGAVTVAAAGTAWLFRDDLADTLTCFWDSLMLKLNSRLLKTTGFILNDAVREKGERALDPVYTEECFFIVTVMISVIIAVLFTASVRRRFRFSVPLAAVTVISAPAIAAETAGYLNSYFVFLVCILGFEAVNSSYELDSSFIYGSLTSAHLNTVRADKEHSKLTGKLILAKKAESDTVRYHRYSDNMIAMAVISAAVFFGTSALIPDGKGINYREVFETINSLGNNAAEKVGDLLGITIAKADDRGYFSSGTYGDPAENISLRPPSENDYPVLEVKLSRNDIPVYLRGDIGTEYSDNSWSSVRTADERFRGAVAESFYPETEYQVFRRLLTASGEQPDDILPLQMVSSKYIRSTRVVFQPAATYELNYRTNSVYDCFGDFILRAKSGYVKTCDGLALTPDLADTQTAIKMADLAEQSTVLFLSDHTISAPEMSNEYYLGQIDAYRAYIDSTYRKSDPVIKDLVSALPITQHSSPSEGYSEAVRRFDAALSLCDYFSANFTYSLSVDNGEDMLSGFLYDTHSGHCALFATAATLALREMGIPARYVTGYVVYPGEAADSEGSYSATLTERQLHAWTEVYFRGIGWLPFDPTANVPGYAETVFGAAADTVSDDGSVTSAAPEELQVTENTDAAADVSAETTADSGNTDDPVEPDVSGEPDDGDGPSPSSGRSDLLVRLLPIIAIMAVIIALAAVTILFFRNLAEAERKTLKSFRTLPPAEATALMYRFVMTLLAKKGLIPGNEQFYDFAERVDGSIELKGLNAFLMDIMPIFEKCEFGDPDTAPVTEDERNEVFRYTSAVYGKVSDDMSYFKRIFMKISLFL